MPFNSKLVAAFLLATVLLLPLATFAICAESSNMPAHCPLGCPMAKIMAKMRMHQNGDHFSAKRDYSCCTIENAAPAPVTESQTVAPIIVAELAPSLAEPLVAVNIERTASGDASPPQAAPSQSRLCTFLI